MVSQMDFTWALALIPFLSAGAGAYFGGYFKTKGENFATHEDIDKLVDQVRAVTTTTKEIEAKISNEVWDRQKQWELKRDSLFEVGKSMTAMIDALTELYSFYDTENKRGGDIPATRKEKQLALVAAYNNTASEFDNAALLAGIVCGKELQTTTLSLGRFVRDTGMEAPRGTIEFFETKTRELVQKRQAVITAIRKELGIDPQSTPLSSVSSAAPSPG
jgi:hypothetical protein